jgi:hypothetical protein
MEEFLWPRSLDSSATAFHSFYKKHQAAQPETFPPGTDPYGVSYGEWSAEWWKWLNSSPEDRNPATDTTGAFCAENQNASGPAWFLAGTFGSKEVGQNRKR